MTDICQARAPQVAARSVEPDGEFWRNFFAHRELFQRMCVRWLRGNHHDAEDALSRGALRALDFLRRHPGRVDKYRPWMMRILQNLCADMREMQDRIAELPRCDAEDERATEFASPAMAPDRALYARELRGVLDEAVAGLPGWLQSVFRVHIVDEVAYTEICRRFQISPENARQRIQQARKRLRLSLVRFT